MSQGLLGEYTLSLRAGYNIVQFLWCCGRLALYKIKEAVLEPGWHWDWKDRVGSFTFWRLADTRDLCKSVRVWVLVKHARKTGSRLASGQGDAQPAGPPATCWGKGHSSKNYILDVAILQSVSQFLLGLWVVMTSWCTPSAWSWRLLGRAAAPSPFHREQPCTSVIGSRDKYFCSESFRSHICLAAAYYH